MKRFLAVSALALSLGACSYLQGPTATALNGINAGVAKADAFVTAKIAPTVVKADDWLVANLGPYLHTAAQAVFCNKYAQRAFDASEKANQPATCGAP